MRGKEPDIPYQPWALEYTMRQNPPTGPDAKFELNTDPHIHTCEPLGLGRIYMYLSKTKFIQTQEAVYILSGSTGSPADREASHFIERYRKNDDKTIQIDMTIDDPGAYTRPWPGRRILTRSATGFMRYQWVCSVRDSYENYEKIGRPGNPGATTFN